MNDFPAESPRTARPESQYTISRLAHPVAVLEGPDYRLAHWNSAFSSLMAEPAEPGVRLRDVLPEFETSGQLGYLREVYYSYCRHENCGPVRFGSKASAGRYFEFSYRPMHAPSGQFLRILLKGTDVTHAVTQQRKRREAEHLARATLSALNDHIVILDQNGVICAANGPWERFSAENGADPSSTGVGANYLDACDRAASQGDEIAASVAKAIRALIAGSREEYRFEYTCHAPNEERWFVAKLTRTECGGVERIVAAHENLTDLRKTQRELAYLATHDALTGVPNRNLFEKLATERLERRSGAYALLFLDLDNFKNINDVHGHLYGDAVLRAFAESIDHLLPSGDLFARLAGDEFVILGGAENEQDAVAAATRLANVIKQHLSKPLSVEGCQISLSVSVGVSLFPCDGESLPELMKQADSAMYQSKREGRGTHSFYTPSLSRNARDRLVIESELRSAIARGQLELYFQPVIDLSTARIASAEALLRWNHPDLGSVSPAKFIPIAEESSLILDVGQWVVQEACSHLRRWSAAGLPRMPVSINVSARQLQNEGFVRDLMSCVMAAGVTPGDLDLEITERTAMTHSEFTHQRLCELEKLGFSLTIDDFGTGYSSLHYLQIYPLDKIKIDGAFVAGLTTKQSSSAIVRSVIALGKCLEVGIVAEGVETPEQASALAELGCDYAQGFLYSHPLSAQEFENNRNVALMESLRQELLGGPAVHERRTTHHAELLGAGARDAAGQR
ncbi:EAL domain-containing protein [Aestuariivirga sp.]|uniref:EAL domain-containing protein n=1 Tax=Aestuariivirga sp. TaxID=2650926 RepID=UPI003919322B